MNSEPSLALRPTPLAPPVRSAMLLAAGLGKRMRPLTATRPKPMVEVAGKPLIDHALDRLRSAGVERAVVNVHYLADSLESHMRRAKGIEVVISDERDLLLETGGGIVKALPLLEDERFLAVNTDNLWFDGPIDAIRLLGDRWDDAEMDALLLLVPLARANCHTGQGDFHMDPSGRLARRRPGRVAPFVYTGVQLLARRLFEGEAAEPFSMNRMFDKAIAAGRLFGIVHQGLWFDVGTPPAIGKAEALLREG